jgi:hypothetical protein
MFGFWRIVGNPSYAPFAGAERSREEYRIRDRERRVDHHRDIRDYE